MQEDLFPNPCLAFPSFRLSSFSSLKTEHRTLTAVAVRAACELSHLQETHRSQVMEGRSRRCVD